MTASWISDLVEAAERVVFGSQLITVKDLTGSDHLTHVEVPAEMFTQLARALPARTVLSHRHQWAAEQRQEVVN
ncbi:MAG: hypothetical protein H0W90_08110 [Actinobacteria bacterium]|nr:hypothetical protein [Actinomycetota bacterium]